MVFVSLVPSCLRGYFVGPICFLVAISWVQKCFSVVVRGSKMFFRGYFVGPKIFLLGILCIQKLLSGAFRGSKMFSHGDFMSLIFLFS